MHADLSGSSTAPTRFAPRMIRGRDCAIRSSPGGLRRAGAGSQWRSRSRCRVDGTHRRPAHPRRTRLAGAGSDVRCVERCCPATHTTSPRCRICWRWVISATALAVGALRAAGNAGSGLTARTFIESCQNFAEGSVSEFDDGGFFFALDDPIRNKAGSAGRDAQGRARFHSYGSATCDGYLALRACGLPREHPRVRGAGEWLRNHCDGLTTAGIWPANQRRRALRWPFTRARHSRPCSPI